MDAFNQTKTQLFDLIRPFIQFKGLFILAFLSVFMTVTFLTFTTQEIYEAEATLLIQQRESNSQQTFTLPNIYAQKYMVKNQVAILESRTVAQNTIDILRESVLYDSMYFWGNRIEKSFMAYLPFPLFNFSDKHENKKANKTELIRLFQKNSSIATELESDIIQIRFKITRSE